MIILTFRPTKIRVQHDCNHWFVRAQQTSALGTTWITIARRATHAEALNLASLMTERRTLATDGIVATESTSL